MSSTIAAIRHLMAEHRESSAEVRVRIGDDFDLIAETAASIADIIASTDCGKSATAVLDDLVLDCADAGGDTDEGSAINNSGTAAQLAYLFSHNGMNAVNILRIELTGALAENILNKPPFAADARSA